ncbi:MAG TPA: NADPH:quinone oxidoreductase family protein [Geminicoccaceae bacterium]|jgi:NADPH2:quinone reductase|nr:NADPH:quinone oxidoreductase family protein [Geminicoccaceae bacterium]HZA66309.1 NADPH:quinone oxidoreductase family protein [Geminicoccaceae bacterium]
MRAIVVREFGPPDAMALEEWPVPEPGPGQIRLDVHAIDVNYPDLLVIGGKYQVLPERPFVPGKCAAGVVSALGDGARHCRLGDRVVAQVEHGAYAEQILADDEDSHVIPDAMSFTEAAAMGLVYQTAHFALIDRGGFRAGETVLVTGAGGGVGLAAVQLVKALGGTALAGTRSPAKADAIRSAGADAIIDLGAENLRDSLREQVFAATDDRGADVVLDLLGGDVFDAAIRSLAWRGRIVIVGFAAGRIPKIRANYLLVKNISASGLQWSDYRERDPAWVRRVQSELFELYEAGRLRPRVMRTFPMAAFADALDLVASGQVCGKVVLTTGSGG